MAAKKKAIAPSERRRWETTYNNLVHLLRTQQIQLETLLAERKLLERLIKTQQNRWTSVVAAAQDQIFQMKCDMAIEDDARLLRNAKSDLMAGLAKREAARLKLMLDYAESELAGDHKNFLDALHRNTRQSKDPGEGGSIRSNRKKGFKSDNKRSEVLESEIIQLRAEYDELSLKKTAEVSALLLEKDFVWHQLKTLENDYADKLRRKADEVEKANEKIANLIAGMEELQSSNSEKDKNIQALRSKIAKMEVDAISQRNEMARVNYQLEILRKPSSFVASPSLRRCSTESKRSNLGPKSDDISRNRSQVKKEHSDLKGSILANNSVKGSCTGSKRKMIDVITIPETPKLFSASFKAPKLKHSSPSINASRRHSLQ